MSNNGSSPKIGIMPNITPDQYDRYIAQIPYDILSLRLLQAASDDRFFGQQRLSRSIAGRRIGDNSLVFRREAALHNKIFHLSSYVGYYLLSLGFQEAGQIMPEKFDTERTAEIPAVGQSEDVDNGMAFIYAVKKWFEVQRPTIDNQEYGELEIRFNTNLNAAVFMGAAEAYTSVRRALVAQSN